MKQRLIQKFALLIFSIVMALVAPNAFADTTKLAYLKDETSGDTLTYRVVEDQTAWGEREVVISHEEIRKFAPNTSVVALVGRDLDGDGVFDAWFYTSDDGIMESVQAVAKSKDGWETASEILKTKTRLDNRWLAGILLNSVMTKISITQSHNNLVFHGLMQQQIELLDLDIRAKRIAAASPHSSELLPIYITISDGWADISSMASMKAEIVSALGDLLIYLSGAVVFKAFSKLAPWIESLSRTSKVVAAANETIDRFFSAVKTRASASLERVAGLQSFLARTSTQFSVPYAFAKLAVKDRVGILIKGLEARGKIGNLMAKALIEGGGYGADAIHNVPYIALSQSLQLVSEVWDKRKIVYSSNPIILAHNVASNRDIIQDMAYMTVDSTVTTSIISRNGNGLIGYGKAGVFSMFDSNAMSYLTTGKLDMRRNAFDTGWEVAIGNLQTVFDMRTLNYFERLAMQSPNRNLKLVGYFITGIDQFVGYIAYGKLAARMKKPDASTSVEQEVNQNLPAGAKIPQAPTLTLTPILAPAI